MSQPRSHPQKHKHQHKSAKKYPTKSKGQPFAFNRPPLSEEAETEYYLLEEEQGVYAQFWQNLGYYQEHGVEDYPPFSRASLDPKRANNRARGWNGLLSFSLKWKEEATPEIRNTILTTLTLAYGWKLASETTVDDWLYEDPLEVEILLNGQRVKNLTRMLNRQYQKGYLIWKEL